MTELQREAGGRARERQQMDNKKTRALPGRSRVQEEERRHSRSLPLGSFPHSKAMPALPRSPHRREVGGQPQLRRKQASQAGGWAWECQGSSQVAMATETKRG